MNCPFCTSTDIHNRTIVENELASAFLTNIPIVPGHTLVVPKRHIAKYELLTEAEKLNIEELRLEMLQTLTKTFSATGFNFAWNDEKVAGQSVPHFHLHIVPRHEGDTGIYRYDPRQFLYRPGSRAESPENELREISSLLASQLDRSSG